MAKCTWRLVVEGHQLATAVPWHLRIVVGRVDALSVGVHTGELATIVLVEVLVRMRQ